MHRSGTSMLAGCLHLLGVNFGKALMPGDRSNAAGYFENLDVVTVHEILLGDLGCRWDMVGALPDGWIESEAASTASGNLARIIERQFQGRGLWAVKDPRMNRLMPVWFRALSTLGLEPRFVHVLRHPSEVARSLEVRDGIDPRKGHLLWLAHQWDALQASERHPRVRLRFDQLLEAPVTAMQSIATSLGIELPRKPEDRARELASFACPELRHHRVSLDNGSSPSFATFDWIYEQLGNADAAPARSAASPVAELTERDAGADVVETLLSLIGDFERRELDAAAERERRILATSDTAELLHAEIFVPSVTEGPEHAPQAATKILLAEEWQLIELDIPRAAALRTRPLRIDPLNTRGIVSVESIRLSRVTEDETLWIAKGASGLAQCTVTGDAFVVPDADALVIVGTDADPQILLPKLPDLPDVPLRLQIWLKPSRSLRSLEPRWSRFQRTVETLEDELSQTQASLAAAKRNADELSQAQESLAAAKRNADELSQAQESLAELKRDAAELRQRADELLQLADQVPHLREALSKQEESARERSAALAQAEEALVRERSSSEEAWSAVHRLRDEKKLLVGWLRELDRSFAAILTTRRWRVGDALGRVAGAVRFRREVPSAVASTRRLLDDFAASDITEDDTAPPAADG